MFDIGETVGNDEQPNMAEIISGIPDGSRHVIGRKRLFLFAVQSGDCLLQVGREAAEASVDVCPGNVRRNAIKTWQYEEQIQAVIVLGKVIAGTAHSARFEVAGYSVVDLGRVCKMLEHQFGEGFCPKPAIGDCVGSRDNVLLYVPSKPLEIFGFRHCHPQAGWTPAPHWFRTAPDHLR
ncbi:hypothetical protein OSZ70_25410 [Rhizobium leguminosarum]